jgi:DNA-binding response OmpR family regulator
MDSKKHILLVEDDESMGFLLKDSLEKYTYCVTLCSDGASALAAFNTQSFDVCLFDVMTPSWTDLVLLLKLEKVSRTFPSYF